MDFKFTHLEKQYKARIEKSGDDYEVIIDDMVYEIKNLKCQQNIISFRLDEKFYNVYFTGNKGKIYLAHDGNYFILELESGSASRSRGPIVQKGDSVSSLMPGLLVKVLVAVGEKIKAGDTLAIVEAMKMENELHSPRDGVVKSINYKEGEQVDALKTIVELE